MSKPLIAVNGAIQRRGTSGTARACDQYVTAFNEMGLGAEVVMPPWPARSRSGLINAVKDAWWDMWGAARASPTSKMLVSPCNLGRGRSGVPHVLVVQDVMILEIPESFDAAFTWYFRFLLPISVRHATRIITTSEHTRRRLLKIAPQADVRVVYLPGRGQASRRETDPFHNAEPLTVLMVGATEPHKNHVQGILAVLALRRAHGLDARVRIVGPVGRAEPEIERCLSHVDPEGAWSSREVDVADHVLDEAFQSAWCLLQPSLNEGFGLPVVEACQWGLPVVHSGAGALTEVMPSASAQGTTSMDLVARMVPLTNAEFWRVASTEALDNYTRYTWPVFRQQLHAAVIDLLHPEGDE